MKIDLSDEAVKILCIEIAAQAAKDYMKAYKEYRKAEDLVAIETMLYGKSGKRSEQKLRDAKGLLSGERKYLMSQRFQFIMNVEPSRLIRILEESVDKKLNTTY